MKKIYSSIILLSMVLTVLGQDIKVQRIQDWNTLKYPGFYESINGQNTPLGTQSWFWGLNLSHTNNLLPGGGYHGAQLAFPVSFKSGYPDMFIRTTSLNGTGLWAKVLTDKGTNWTLGSPLDTYAHNTFDLKPGGSESGFLFSVFRMYTAPKRGENTMTVSITSHGSSFFNGGSVGIGTKSPTSKLDVRGTITASEVKVEIISGSDYVFDPEYNLASLSEVETFIKENKHLPEIPSEEEMQRNGLNISDFQIKLLQKIEELTLYVIELKKENQEIKAQLNNR